MVSFDNFKKAAQDSMKNNLGQPKIEKEGGMPLYPPKGAYQPARTTPAGLASFPGSPSLGREWVAW